MVIEGRETSCAVGSSTVNVNRNTRPTALPCRYRRTMSQDFKNLVDQDHVRFFESVELSIDHGVQPALFVGYAGVLHNA
jgi:hypothetical protein